MNKLLPVQNWDDIFENAKSLLVKESIATPSLELRLLGVRTSNFSKENDDSEDSDESVAIYDLVSEDDQMEDDSYSQSDESVDGETNKPDDFVLNNQDIAQIDAFMDDDNPSSASETELPQTQPKKSVRFNIKTSDSETESETESKTIIEKMKKKFSETLLSLQSSSSSEIESTDTEDVERNLVLRRTFLRRRSSETESSDESDDEVERDEYGNRTTPKHYKNYEDWNRDREVIIDLFKRRDYFVPNLTGWTCKRSSSHTR